MKIIAVLSVLFAVLSVCAEPILATGYVRGKGRTTLKNKYSAYVSKVNIYSHTRVKKGDVILEYDDLEIRTKIDKKKLVIAEQEQTVELKKVALKITELNPLPSEYRNLNWKYRTSEARFKRFAREFEVYSRLYANKAVADVDLWEKEQNKTNYEAELASLNSDMKIVKKGLADLYVKRAKTELAEAELTLAKLKKELELLEEERKYYRIVAPYDGVCITDSDTVNGYYTSGTTAASVHRDEKKKVYAYVREKDLPLLTEGKTYRFLSNQYGYESKLCFELKLYEVDTSRKVYGNETFFQAKFHVVTEPEPLRIDSLGSVVLAEKYH